VSALIKANTSAGWKVYLKPGEELVAPRDAVVVARLAAPFCVSQRRVPLAED
jgi:hypothetical protein